MSKKPTIRAATPDDFKTIIRLLVEMHGEVGQFPISIEKVAARIDEVLEKGVALLAEIDGEAIGTMGLVGETPWYSEQRVVADTWIWTKGPRRLAAFNAMVKAAHDYASANGLPCIITLYSPDSADRKTKLFERHGRRIMEGYQFKPAGGDFLTGKEAQNGVL